MLPHHLVLLLLLPLLSYTHGQNHSLRVNTNLKEVNASALALPSIQGVGNICTREEPYVELLQVPEVQPVRVRTSSWCLDIPPRCASFKTEMREVMRTQVSVYQVVLPACLLGLPALPKRAAIASLHWPLLPHKPDSIFDLLPLPSHIRPNCQPGSRAIALPTTLGRCPTLITFFVALIFFGFFFRFI